MALSTFPRDLYKRLLRSSKIIDQSNCQIALQSILCGKPSSLYSYDLKQNIEIGTNSYSLFDKFVSIMNDGEYSSPTNCRQTSLYSVVKNTAKLCNHKNVSKVDKNNKFSLFSNYCKDIALNKNDLIEIVNNVELLASIAIKQIKSREEIKKNNLLTQQIDQKNENTFLCDIIDWTKVYNDDELQQQIVNVLLNKHTKPPKKYDDKENDEKTTTSKEIVPVKKEKAANKSDIILEYIPKSSNSMNILSEWRGSVLFQHPLAYFNTNQNIIEPQILLGLYCKSTPKKLRLNGAHKKQENNRISLIMNGEKTLMNVEDVCQRNIVEDFNDDKNKKKMMHIIKTFHGVQNVPKMFLKTNLLIGGDDESTIEILTNNPYCKGIPIMNNKLFWNPDLSIAERIVQSGYGKCEQFRFYKGKMSWNDNLFNNVIDRNLYSILSTKNNASTSFVRLAKLMWSYHINDVDDEFITIDNSKKSLWYQLLELCWKSDTKEIESWMKLFDMIKENNLNINHEIYQLMQKHDDKIAQQVKIWSQHHK